MAGDADNGFSGRTAVEIVGISYRQLDYWARTDLVRPSLSKAQGSGSRRRYGYRDLLELKVVKSLLDAGIRLETVRQIFGYVREHLTDDIASLNLVINGSDSVVVEDGTDLIDIVRSGQGVLNILPLGGVQEAVDAKILSMQPGDIAGPGDAAVPVDTAGPVVVPHSEAQ